MAREDMREVLLVEDDVADVGPRGRATDAGRARPAGPAGQARAARAAGSGRRWTADAGPRSAARPSPESWADVVLEPWSGPSAAPSSPAGSAPPRRPGRPRRALALVAGVLAAAVVATAAVQDSAERRRVAVLAEVAGVVEPVGPALGERWRAPAAGRRTATPGGDLLVTVRDPRPGAAVSLVDGATGRVRWSAPLPELGVSGLATCAASVDDGPGSTVVCRTATAMVSLGFGRRRLAQDARTALVVLDAGTGERVATHDLGRRFPGFAPIGTDVVLAEVAADGRAEITRSDPVTGRARWTFRSPEPVGALSAGSAPELDVRHGVVAVGGPGGWALDPDGRLLGSWSPQRPGSPVDVDPSVDLQVLPDGRFVVGEPDAGGLDGLPWGTVSASDERDGFAVPGPVVDPAVDDGSAAGILLVAPPGRGVVVAVDPATGRTRWQVEARGDVVVVDGRLHARAGPAVSAVDVGTGRTVWRTEIPTRRSSRDLMTDGTVLLVPTSTPQGDPTVTALGLDDGRERWTVAAPARVEEYLVLGHRLVALTEDQAVGLG
jgi:outer membrane protein assembly factor BamB